MTEKFGDTSLTRGRVVDMLAFQRCVDNGDGAPRISRVLGVPRTTAQALMVGEHWQQRPARVRRYNELRGANIDPETGVPTGDDLAKFGGLVERAITRKSAASEKDVARVLAAAGVDRRGAADVAARMIALSGGEVALPARFDTAGFLELTEERLWLALKSLDATVISKAGPRDLTAMISMLVEKRQLLKGEPTSIVRSEHRGALEQVGALLLKEMQRRGLKLEGEAKVEAKVEALP